MGYLRLILSLSVILYHAGPLFGYIGMNGLVAVHIFFIISGFYMALIIKNKYTKSKKPYYTFITNRFLRIYPIYWVILILTIYVQFSQLADFNIFSTLSHYVDLRKPFGVIEDFTLLIRRDYLSIDMFRYDSLTVGPAWTLVLEFIFYLAAPFLLLIKRRYLFSLTLVSLLIYYLITHYHFLKGDHYIQTFFIPANFFFFMTGIFSYYIYEEIKKRKIKIKYSFILCLLFLITVILWNYIPDISLRWALIKEWLLYLVTPFILPLLFESFNLFPLNNFMADLSYPTYITHMLSINFLQISLNYKITEKLFSSWTVIITLLISIILVYAIEKPIDKLRQKRIKH